LLQLRDVYSSLLSTDVIAFPIIAGNSSSIIRKAVVQSLYHADWVSLSPFLEVTMLFQLLKSRCGILPPTLPENFCVDSSFQLGKERTAKLHNLVWRCLVRLFFRTGGVTLCISWIWQALTIAIRREKIDVNEFVYCVEQEFEREAREMIDGRMSKTLTRFDQLALLYLTSFPVQPEDLVNGTDRTIQEMEADGWIWTVSVANYKNVIIPEVLLHLYLTMINVTTHPTVNTFAASLASSLILPVDTDFIQETLLKLFRWSDALQVQASLLNFSGQQLGLRFEAEVAYFLLFRILTPIGSGNYNAKKLCEIFPECQAMPTASAVIPPNLFLAKSQYQGGEIAPEWKNGGIVINCAGAEYADVILFGFLEKKLVQIAVDTKCIRTHSPQAIFEEYSRCTSADTVIAVRPFIDESKQKLSPTLTPYWTTYLSKLTHQQKESDLFKTLNREQWIEKSYICTGRSLVGEMAFNWLKNDLENSRNLGLTLHPLKYAGLQLVRLSELKFCQWRK
jgi:hypothetical protein